MSNRIRILAAVFAVLLLASSCTAETGESSMQEPEVKGEYAVTDVDFSEAKEPDSINRVFYEIFVGSFSDSNGDGSGDLRGIINRMDYLNDGDPGSGKSLGVEGIWLTPIFKSYSYHKYNVNDYFTIDPNFGTMEDLKELIALCHERGVKLILDLVINHTGTGIEWFKRFSQAHKDLDDSDPYYEYYTYIGADDPTPHGRTFQALTGTNIRYECNFSGDMPELNYDNEAVREEVLNVAKYYIDLGIDGFRFDAAKYIYYMDDARSVDFWQWYCSELRKLKNDIYLVGEVWDTDGVTDKYFPAMNCFNFSMSQASGQIAMTAKKAGIDKFTSYVQNYLNKVKAMREDATIIPFIANHDNDRAAGFLLEMTGEAKMGANLLLLSPGSPFIYYGEEIGMRGSRGGANTDANRRLAMLWGDDDKVKDPTGSNYGKSNQTSETVLTEIASEDSLYTHYKKLIMIRRANPEIASGSYRPISLGETTFGGFASTLNGKTVVVLHNTGASAKSYDLSKIGGISVSRLAASIGNGSAALEGTTVTVDAQTSVVLR
ncbi:MAG: hypothetical protein IK088_00945 [Lachnospiraceae bacterium]|nr:hypothetical protein [Lachnospiraceae bacterium]